MKSPQFHSSRLLPLTLILAAFCSRPPAYAEDPSRQEKYRVCFSTIGTADERKLFRKYLSEKDFEFVELLRFDTTEERKGSKWFEEACRQKIECDVWVISGEYADGFFSEESDFKLPIEDLEKHSCKNDCRGLLNRPREVFLLGCNTLATKDPDQRSPEEYYQTLLDHDMDPETARRVVRARYSIIDSPNINRMRRSFAEVPHLYGFDSKGPSGASIHRFLDDYLKRAGNYAEYLERDALSELSVDLTKMNQNRGIPAPRRNPVWDLALKGTAYAQCSGISPDDPEAEKKKLTCALYDERLSVPSKLEVIGQILQRKDSLHFFGQLERFFDQNPPEKYTPIEKLALEKAARSSEKTKAQYRNLIAETADPETQLDLLNLSYRLGWVGREETRSIQKKILAPALLKNTLPETLNQLCSLAKSTLLAPSDFPEGWSEDPELISRAGCLNTVDPSIQKELLSLLKSERAEIRGAASSALGKIQDKAPETLRALLSAMSSSNEQDWRRTSEILSYTYSRNWDPFVADFLPRLRGSPTERLRAYEALSAGKFTDPRITKLLLNEIEKLPSQTTSDLQVGALQALSKYESDIEPKTQRTIAQKFDDSDSSVRAEAMTFFQIKKASDPQVIEKITEKIDSQAFVDRAAMALALTESSKSEEIERLLASKLGNPETDASILYAISSITPNLPEVQKRIVDWMLQAEPHLRSRALSALGKGNVKDPEILQRLASLLPSLDLESQVSLLRVFESSNVRTPAVLQAIEQLITARGVKKEVRRTAIRTRELLDGP